MSILDEIFAHKRVEIAVRKQKISAQGLLTKIGAAPASPDFVASVRDDGLPAPRLIAEVKHRSPSKGVLAASFNPLQLAKAYAENGAAAISVLTDKKYFGGALGHLEMIARAGLSVPLLRKDFIFDSYQLLEARAAGASAALLIVAMLEDSQLEHLLQAAAELTLAALVEVHDQAELERAVAVGARLIGINNRNLHDFNVSLKTSLRLSSHRPAGSTLVAESGIRTLHDIERLRRAGVDAILVGETLVTAGDRAAKTAELARVPVRLAE